jgi:predicted acyltransferase
MAARLSSVDAFRGITVAGMVIVNNPGSWDAIYWPLEHAEWNGWTPTDLIFPFFVFLVGVSLALSWQTITSSTYRIVERGALIICLGLFMAGFPFFNPTHWRIPGVLQRIGLCYLGAAFIYRRTRNVKVLAAITALLLVGYWALLATFGDLTPDGNIGARIDHQLLGSHLWRQRNWDPEGLLSTVPAIGTALSGVIAGLWLNSPAAGTRKVAVLLVSGAALFVAGLAWNPWFPINKSLWTSSYVLLSAGAAAMLLAACVYLIDERGIRAWSYPFVVFGRNAIALFVVSGLIGKLLIMIPAQVHGSRNVLQSLIFDYAFAWISPPEIASLSYATVFLALMYGLCHFLYRRGIFLRA